MSDNQKIGVVVAVFLAGFVVGSTLMASSPSEEKEHYKQTQQLIKECESTLRRDEHCALIAVRTED